MTIRLSTFLDLGAYNFDSQFNLPNRQLIPAALVEGGAVAYLSTLRLSDFRGVGGEGIIDFHTEAEDGTSGADLISAWETSAEAIVLSNAAAGDITIAGPNAPGSILIDADEPYRFTPTNWQALDTWIANLSGDITLTLETDTPEMAESATLTVTATISGGLYDDITYAWSVVSGGGSIVGNEASATYTPPDLSADTAVTIRLTVTVTQLGGPAKTSQADLSFTVRNEPAPDAVAPTVAIAPIGTVDEGATQSLTATLTGGTYDALAYLWEVTFGNGTISNSTSASATYNAPAVTSDESVQVRLTVTASGTGTNAADGTSDDGIDFESFTVEDVPAVITTDTDRIYTLGEVEPGRPTGGETQENHLPAGGWSRTAQEPTELAAVYTSARTRTFTNGVFTSALLWGPVTGSPAEIAGAVRLRDAERLHR